jgi:hypothetical protein
MTSPRHAFRMPDETAEAFRAFVARLAAAQSLPGRRVTQATAMAALLAVGDRHREEVLAELAKAPQSAE